MAEINFLPVCSNCHEILYNQEIDYKRGSEETICYSKRNNNIELLPQHITPYLCPKCHEVIECITIPIRLPFYIKKGDPSID